MRIEEKARELGREIPEIANTGHPFVPGRIVGNILYVSGSTALVNGKLPCAGSVGAEITVEQAQECAIITLLNCLAKAKAVLGDLDRIKQMVKINGYIASAPGFCNQAIVMNAASQFCVDLMGEAGKHARTACGVMALPGGSPVEIEFVAEIAE